MKEASADEPDVVLVGLGAAGGIAAHVLTLAGRNVLAVEAGPERQPDEMTLDEIRNEIDQWLCDPKSAKEVPMYRSDDSCDSVPSPYPTLMPNGVGGAAIHYPGTSPRLSPWNFSTLSRTIERYDVNVLPLGANVVDWPIVYHELEPYYTLVEDAIGVSGEGARGESHECGGRGNPFEGYRSTDYPMPPLRRSDWNRLMADSAIHLGWHPYPTPTAINSIPYNGNPACTYCGFCENNGCYIHAKGSPGNTVVPRARNTGRLRKLTQARVTSIEVDERGHATGVNIVKNGQEWFQSTSVVFLAAHTYENIRLLLNSKSGYFPNGLANNGGQVGKYFMPHVNPEVHGVFPGRDLRLYTGSWAQGVCVDDWNGDNFDHSPLGFLAGGMLTAAHELLKPIALSQSLPERVGRPWGRHWKRWIYENAMSVAAINGQVEVLPYKENCLDLHPNATDAFGLPLVRITFRMRKCEMRATDFIITKLRLWLEAAGASETWLPRGPFIEMRTAYGGARMGTDPAASVVDPFGFTHEAPNVGMLGACVFPTAGGYNPTLTLQALAWRSAQQLVDNWDEIAK